MAKFSNLITQNVAPNSAKKSEFTMKMIYVSETSH